MRYLFLAYLLINPVFFVHGWELRTAQEWCYQLTSVIIIVASVFFEQGKVKKSKFNLWLGVLVLWFLAVNAYFVAGWSIILNLFLGFGVYLAAIRSLKKEDTLFLIKGTGVVVILALFVWAMQFLGWDLFGMKLRSANYTLPPDCSFFGIKAALGMYLAAVIPLLLSFSWVGLALFIPLALTYSTGAFLGGVAATMFFLWFRKRILFWIGVPLLLLGTVFFVLKMDMPTGMFGTRIPMWKEVINDSFKNAISGHGLDSFRNPQRDGYARYYKYTFNNETVKLFKKGNEWGADGNLSSDTIDMLRKNISALDFWDNPHCLYIHILYETGVTGVLLFFIVSYQGWLRFKRSRKETITTALMASMIAFGVFSFTQFPFHLSRVGNMFPIILGLFYIHTEEE